MQGPKVRSVWTESGSGYHRNRPVPCRVVMTHVWHTVLRMQRGSKHNVQSYSSAPYFVFALGLPRTCFYENQQFPMSSTRKQVNIVKDSSNSVLLEAMGLKFTRQLVVRGK